MGGYTHGTAGLPEYRRTALHVVLRNHVAPSRYRTCFCAYRQTSSGPTRETPTSTMSTDDDGTRFVSRWNPRRSTWGVCTEGRKHFMYLLGGGVRMEVHVWERLYDF